MTYQPGACQCPPASPEDLERWWQNSGGRALADMQAAMAVDVVWYRGKPRTSGQVAFMKRARRKAVPSRVGR